MKSSLHMGSEIKVFLFKSGMTRLQLAKKLKLGEAMITHVLNGRRRLHVRHLAKLAKITGVAVAKWERYYK